MNALADDGDDRELCFKEENLPCRHHRPAFPTVSQAILAIVAVSAAAVLLQGARSWVMRRANVSEVVSLASQWEQWQECADNAMLSGGFCFGKPNEASCKVNMAFMCCKVVKASKEKCCGREEVKKLVKDGGSQDCEGHGAVTQPPKKQAETTTTMKQVTRSAGNTEVALSKIQWNVWQRCSDLAKGPTGYCYGKHHRALCEVKLALRCCKVIKASYEDCCSSDTLRNMIQNSGFQECGVNGPTTTTTTLKQLPGAAKGGEDCVLHGGRCANKKTRCYKKDAFYAGCRLPPCTPIYKYDSKPRSNWTCEEVVPTEDTMEMK